MRMVRWGMAEFVIKCTELWDISNLFSEKVVFLTTGQFRLWPHSIDGSITIWENIGKLWKIIVEWRNMTFLYQCFFTMNASHYFFHNFCSKHIKLSGKNINSCSHYQLFLYWRFNCFALKFVKWVGECIHPEQRDLDLKCPLKNRQMMFHEGLWVFLC